MADYTDIIQEINTNLPDNNTQSITAEKLRDTLIDLTTAIETNENEFEAELVVDSLKSSETTKALSANNGYELSKRSTMLEFVGADNTLQTNYLYCLSGHKYKIYLDNTEFTWNNVTYSTSSYYIWRITVVDYNNDNETVISSRGCDNKVDPLNPTYTFTANKNGYIRFSFRADEGQTLRIRIEDITISSSLEDSIDDINQAFSNEVTPEEILSITGKFYSGSVGSAISTSNSTNMRGKQYSVVAGKQYHTVVKLASNYTALYILRYTDENNIILSRYYLTSSTTYQFDAISKAPEGAAYAYVNYLSTNESTFSFTELQTNYVNVNEIANTTSANSSAIAELESDMSDVKDSLEEITDNTTVEPDTTVSGYFIKGSVNSVVETGSSTNMRYRRFPVTPGQTYWFEDNTSTPGIASLYLLFWTDSDQKILKRQFWTQSGVTEYPKEVVVAPEGAAYAFINYYSSTNNYKFESVNITFVNVSELKSDVDELKSQVGEDSKLMKVVIKGGFLPTNYGWETAYYIRTKYNENEDIIIQNKINSNFCLSFNFVYVGPNDKTDTQLMTSTYRVVDCGDSTAPFYRVNLYWHLYAQHGCPIPRINNNVGMTTASVGNLWQDTITYQGEPFVRQYHIGYVSDQYIYLLPVYYEDSYGRMTRGWKNDHYSTDITTLEFVEAQGSGTDEGISTINVAGYGQVQKYPMMITSDRKFIVDGAEINEIGTYYCNEFGVSEFQVGYDPATIPDADWFAGTSNRVSLENAEPLVNFTWDYLYKGATCSMNTTVKILREIECQSWGAIQQQYFHSQTYNGNTYTAKFMIPKLKNYRTPFDETSSNVNYYRTSTYLDDVNDPVDRQIGYLVNTAGTNDYRIGMAAGLSLVSGDTVKSKRIQMLASGSSNEHYRMGTFSPSNTNKFYIAAFNTGNYADNQYNLPVGFLKQINCYVSYFDPAQNNGQQVYWYKEGNGYVIYCHSQEEVSEEGGKNVLINVPTFMDGLSLSLVEKTDNASLVTETIVNGKFYVNYTGTDHIKYIVLKAN